MFESLAVFLLELLYIIACCGQSQLMLHENHGHKGDTRGTQ